MFFIKLDTSYPLSKIFIIFLISIFFFIKSIFFLDIILASDVSFEEKSVSNKGIILHFKNSIVHSA